MNFIGVFDADLDGAILVLEVPRVVRIRRKHNERLSPRRNVTMVRHHPTWAVPAVRKKSIPLIMTPDLERARCTPLSYASDARHEDLNCDRAGDDGCGVGYGEG